MAEPADEKEIRCEICHTNVPCCNWPAHTKQCSQSEEDETNSSQKRVTSETAHDRIPCKCCGSQVAMDDWESHAKQCTKEHEKRAEKLRNETAEDAPLVFIPCEYCGFQIPAKELEHHSKQCALIMRQNRDDETNVLIPCEYCHEQINANDWDEHLTECAVNSRRDESAPMNTMIPCEYCNVLVDLQELEEHMDRCQEMEQQRLNVARTYGSQSSHGLIPCEICKKSVEFRHFEAHQEECQRKHDEAMMQTNLIGGLFSVPEHWNQLAVDNLSRHTLLPMSNEYKFVEENFHKKLPSNRIVQIERIQNRRWYRQYEAHRDDFIERYGTSTERWLFHGCKPEAVDAIINDCFNRSHAVRCAVGQGIYFATDSDISFSYTEPDENGYRHMFMARVLIGRTTPGHAQTRVCPKGFDTTGGGAVFVTYHDAQAYGEYLITFI